MPEATGLEIAMLRVPGSEVDVELIEYQGCERHSGSSRPCDYGTGHFCVFVTGIDALYEELAARGVALPLRRPGGDERRRQRGRQEPLPLDPDGYIFEFHQRPPR